MKNIYITIKESLITLIKSAFPDTEIFAEEIAKTQADEDCESVTDYFFIDFVPVGCSTIDLYTTSYNILIDVMCYLQSEKNADYLVLSRQLDGIIRPVFHFEDRAITIYSADSKVVDHLLHYSFSLNFYETTKDLPELPFMDGLELKEGS